MPASFDPNHVTKLQELYSFLTGVWGKCKNLFATKTELQEAIASIPDPLPESTSADEGKILTVGSDGSPEWDPAPEALPPATSADEGKVLTVDSNGDPEWSEPPNPQVQADWSQSDSSAVDYIKNKPDLSVYAQTADLAAVAFSGDYDDLADKPDLSVFARSADLATVATTGSYNDLSNIPVDLVQDANYVHTDNNFTSTLKDKLDGIAAGAEVNVQADWNQTNTGSDDYIKNKPTNLVQDASYVHTDNNFTTTLKNKLDGIESGAEVNVQANWTQSDTTKDDYIKNKPTNLVQDASYVHTDNNFTTTLKNKLDGIAAGAEVNVQSNWTQTNTSADDYIKNKPENLVQDASYVHTDNNFTTSEKTKLAGIAAGAEVNVQSDWDQTNSSSDDFIKNKPATKTLLAGPGINVSENANTVTISVDNATEIAYFTPGNSAETDATNIAAAAAAGKRVILRIVDGNYTYDLPLSFWRAGEAFKFTSWVDTYREFIKVLEYANGAWTWNATYKKTVVPNYSSSQATKILAVNAAGTSTEWVDAPSGTFIFSPSADPASDKAAIDSAIAAGKAVILQYIDGNYTFDLPLVVYRDTEIYRFANNDYYRFISIALKYSSNAWTWEGIYKKNVIPNYSSSDSGKYLAVNGTGTGTEWVEAPSTTQVQANWNETDNTDPSYIQNKPTIPAKTSDLTNDSGFITLSDVPAQEQADWNESDSSDPAYIKNKPTIPTVPTTDQTYDATSSNPQSGTAVAGALAGIEDVPAVGSSDDGKVLTASYSGGVGSYSWQPSSGGGGGTVDQTYDPTSTNAQSGTAVAGALATVNQVPASTSADEGKVLKVDANGDPEWGTGGGSGTVDQTYDPTSTNAQSGTAVAGALATVKQVPASTSSDEGKVLKVDANGDPEWATGGGGTQVQADWSQTDSSAVDYIKNKPSLATVATSGSYNDLSNKPSLATVATSGSYNDLSNKPTIIPAWTSGRNSLMKSGSGTSYRYKLNKSAPAYYTGAYDSTNGLRIQEQSSNANYDWDFYCTTQDVTSPYIYIYDSSNNLATGYDILLASYDLVASQKYAFRNWIRSTTGSVTGYSLPSFGTTTHHHMLISKRGRVIKIELVV